MLLINILLAMAWIAITGRLTAVNFLEGFVLSYAVLWFVAPDKRSRYFTHLRRRIAFVLYFLWALLKANLRVAYDVVTITHYMRPAVIALPIGGKSDDEVALLANTITLTPGTLSLAISHDQKWLYVHTMYVDEDIEKAKQEIIEGLGARVQGLFQ